MGILTFFGQVIFKNKLKPAIINFYYIDMSVLLEWRISHIPTSDDITSRFFTVVCANSQ